ncbi:MAG: hypothetical protein IT271_12360, partial [Chitinophagales bacterium]|nr:hypothetical protein [Chitinophagales bacterium]
MKKIFTIVLLVVGFTSFAQTYNGNLVLTNQAQVDTFRYKKINGNLTIKGLSINNIDSLYKLDTIRNGWITIDSTNLTNLYGLRNIKTNTNQNILTISNNPILNNVSSLNVYVSSVNRISIINNPTLTSIDSLFYVNNSVRIKFCEISNNNNLKYIDLTNSSYISELIVRNNHSLAKLTLNSTESNNPTFTDFIITIDNNHSLDSILYTYPIIIGVLGITNLRIENNLNLRYIKNLYFPFNRINKLYIDNNNSLNNLNFIKDFSNLNFTNIDTLVIKNNQNLSNCCGIYNLLLRGAVGSILISNNPSACSSQSEIVTYCNNPATTNFVFGRIYSDLNANNQPDASDVFVDNIKVQATKNGNTISHLSSDTGKYYFVNDTGSYTIQPISNFANFATIPVSQTITRTTYGNKDTINFKLSPTALVNDASVILSNNWMTRPNRNGTYTISYTNESGQNYNGTIKLKLDSRLIYQTATPNPTSIVGDTMIWNITDLPLFTTKNISVDFLASSSLIANDSLKSFVKIYNAQTDVTSANNQYTLTDIVRASYDPNDKVVDKTILSPTEVAQSPYLYYTIRFQNVGNDTAFDIAIRDTLDTNLDWTTFQPITSSHKYSLDQTNNKYVLFGFKSIKLPDSTVNEKASHGFIFYKIKPKNTLVVGNSILNKASIVFDVNTPIVTNNAKTVVMQAYAGRDTSICFGQSITLTASGASSYIWSTGANTASITVSPTSTTSYVVTGTVNGISQNDTVVVFINPAKTTNRAQIICQGQSYNFNGTNLSIAGIYRDTLQQVNGCDSFIVLTLNVNPAKTTNRIQTVCQGQIYNFNGTNLSTAGIYRDTLQQVNGCDSFIVLTLNVNPAKTTNRTQIICEGQSYNFNGTNLSIAGIYRDTLQQVNGCDSFIVLTLNVNPAKT